MSQNPNNEGKRAEEDNKVSEGSGSIQDRIKKMFDKNENENK